MLRGYHPFIPKKETFLDYGMVSRILEEGFLSGMFGDTRSLRCDFCTIKYNTIINSYHIMYFEDEWLSFIITMYYVSYLRAALSKMDDVIAIHNDIILYSAKFLLHRRTHIWLPLSG